MKNTLLKTVSIMALSVAALTTASPAKEAGDLLVRVRAVYVTPDVSATTSIGGTVGIDSSIVPEIDFTYFVTDNIGVELILATTKHNVEALDTALGDVASLGSVWLLPPSLTAQYHFNPKGDFSPYIGAGINYTIFYSANAGAVDDIDYSNSFGPVLQAGFDYKIDENWFFNVDLKKVWIQSDVKINGGAVTADVKINPLLVGVGFGYKF